ncbi:FAD-dependent oxidoreductase [Mucilaginibacter sabulilitoris]|uniref:FAD-dependent oxidoreductase n=1 Tax=Mucilaginibacter sabulilitoris TaxID=1173583 RepID=A0ABZ0TLK6_9SPHI|nr:FAD-dependent oxidoreductase [Mucilaginibacter sabulilitoris]WPU92050.1 FAD-dependent oxidoreductase [Mucilaginibacter sabulilitoris]
MFLNKFENPASVISKFLMVPLLFISVFVRAQPKPTQVDVCIYGGTSAGVIAAYTAAKMGKKVLLIEPGNRLGGLSSGGLGFTDIGNKYVVTGLALDFYRRVGQHYGKFEQWTFEPKVAEAIFAGYVKRGGFQVVLNSRLRKVNKTSTHIDAIELENSSRKSSAPKIIKSKEFIDCTYEGDLMAKAGVSYTTGREGNDVYHETVNGVQLKDKHQFPDGIDPYKIPGKPESGLLWGISPDVLAKNGTGDKRIQSYNFRLCLSNDPSNRIAITKPANYDSTRYELLLRYLAAKPSKDLNGFLKMDLMPNHKTDINNNGPFSTDMIGMNYAYPDGDYNTRAKIIKEHEDYTKGLLYFIGHDPRMPEHLRKQMQEWGYPKDEYLENNHWTPQLYVREARRMLGTYIMTQANCMGKEVVNDEVAKAAYAMDSHNAERIVVNGMVKNEGDVQYHDVHPYPVAYRSITPKSRECTNLLVPVCLSASHMAYGSIRMEPVFMVLGQSAAVAACQAINGKTTVQGVDIKHLQTELKNNPLADHSVPEILVDNDDPHGIVKTGNWVRETVGGYGPSLLIDTLSAKADVKFIPAVQKAGEYHIYFYYAKLPHGSNAVDIKLFDGQNTTNKTIYKKDIEVVGQTSGEWVSLGTSTLPRGKKAYVQVTNDGADGAIVADAVLLVPVKN